MANKEMDATKSYARTDKLLEIETTWWDESDVPMYLCLLVSTVVEYPLRHPADKLALEIVSFGNPPVFHKKSKAASESGAEKYQWEIMKEYGLSDAEISKFQHPSHWLIYFVSVDLKIKSQNEKEKLAQAKRLTCLKGSSERIMLAGEFAGMRVQDAKPLIREKLLKNSQVVSCSEPEKKVMSRSGDECAVTLTDQRYITNEEEEWKKMDEECLSNMKLYHDETHNVWVAHALLARGLILLNSEKMSKSTGNFKTLRQAIKDFSADATRFAQAEILDSESSLRPGPLSTYAQINIAVPETEKNFNEDMFRGALKTGFYDLQPARDEYRFSCGTGGLNTKLSKKDAIAIKEGWPMADRPDLTLGIANMNLQDTIATMRKLLEKQRVTSYPSTYRVQTHDSAHICQRALRWMESECLNILRANFDTEVCQFAPDSENQSALKQSNVGQQANFKQIEVLWENLELIKRSLGLEQVQVLSALNDDDINIAGQHANLLRQTPHSPGSPTAIF
ncbi:hypothetical protein MKW92_011566 [Papaver armeniacum]|nr:hypothetical protein MKW92_011566 [Papaver armeniacum]